MIILRNFTWKSPDSLNVVQFNFSLYIRAFSCPKWVPQMADQKQVMLETTQKHINNTGNLTFSALTPNLKGYDTAISHGCQEVAVFGAASEAFSKKNINCSIEESLKRFEPVCEKAKIDGIPVRGYVSCIAGTPFQGLGQAK